MTYAISNASQFTVRPHKKECEVFLKYTLKEANGAVYEVTRSVIHMKTRHGKVSCSWNANAQLMLKTAQHCEAVEHKKTVVNPLMYRKLSKPKKLIKAAPKPVAKTAQTTTQQLMTTVQGLQSQIKVSNAHVVELNKQLTAQNTQNQKILDELTKTQVQVAKLMAAVKALT